MKVNSEHGCATREGLEYIKQITQTTFMMFYGALFVIFGHHPVSLYLKEQHEHSAKHLLLCPTEDKRHTGLE